MKDSKSDGPSRKPSRKPSESVPDAPRPRKPARQIDEIPRRKPSKQPEESVQAGSSRRPSEAPNEGAGSIQGAQGRRSSKQPSERIASLATTTIANTRTQRQRSLATIEEVQTPVAGELNPSHRRTGSHFTALNRPAPPTGPSLAPSAARRPTAHTVAASAEVSMTLAPTRDRTGSRSTALKNTAPAPAPTRPEPARPEPARPTRVPPPKINKAAPVSTSSDDESEHQETPEITRVNKIVLEPVAIDDEDHDLESDNGFGDNPEPGEISDDERLYGDPGEEVEPPFDDLETESEKEQGDDQDHEMSDLEIEEPEAVIQDAVHQDEKTDEEGRDDMDIDAAAAANAKRKRDQPQEDPKSRKRSKGNEANGQVPGNGEQEQAVLPAFFMPPRQIFQFTPEQRTYLNNALEGAAGILNDVVFDAASRGIQHGIQMANGHAHAPGIVPPVIVPPATVPPAAVPPAAVPSAAGPVAAGPPAKVPLAKVPPARAPPAEAPPAKAPPAKAPPAKTPPAKFPLGKLGVDMDKKGKTNCRPTNMRNPRGCGRLFTAENPPFFCQRETCLCRNMQAVCTMCKNSGRGYLFEATDEVGELWFCQKKCYDSDPRVIAELEKRKKEGEDREKKEAQDGEDEAARANASKLEKLKNSALAVAKRERQKKEKEAAAAREKAREEEEVEESDEVEEFPNKVTEPTEERCKGCKNVWSDTKIHAECEYDGCPGHNICTDCITPNEKKKTWKGVYWRKTDKAPYHWLCRDACRQAFKNQLAEDTVDEESEKPVEPVEPVKPKPKPKPKPKTEPKPKPKPKALEKVRKSSNAAQAGKTEKASRRKKDERTEKDDAEEEKGEESEGDDVDI